MDLIFDRDRSPLDFSRLVGPKPLAYLALERMPFADIRASVALDANGGARWIHVNMGVEPHIYFETFREGDRVLKPLLPHSQWPTTETQAGLLVEAALVVLAAAKEVPDGTTIKLYIPPLRDAHGSHEEARIARERFDALMRTDLFSARKLGLEIFGRGKPILIERGA